MRAKEELEMGQDGFLPLPHAADVFLTLPAGRERGGGMAKEARLILSSPKNATMISTSPGEAQETPFQ